MPEIKYSGTLVLPGSNDEHAVSLTMNDDDDTASLKFGEPVGSSADWDAKSVSYTTRLKYSEAYFVTEDLPVETVELVWKVNSSHDDGTLAGVIIPKPNAHRVSGEKGFILIKDA